MANEEREPDEIDATPTKRLIIDILTRDITVKDCILDLIDNSVDAYISNELSDRRREIRLSISKNEFVIYDNCGGIEYDFLKSKVFRLGAEISQRDKPTLGVYGIGLKRAILKIGQNIEMETDDGKKFCKLNLNVKEWIKIEEWKIPVSCSDSQLTSEDSNKKYTNIKITDLYDHIQEKFNLESFINIIKKSIHITYAYFISTGIDFYVNNEKIEPYKFEVRVDQYQPTKIREAYDGVDIEITCYIISKEGRATKELGQRGWNLFFNKRLILVEDTTPITGWTGERGELPKYHALYNEFRGIVFIQSTDPSALPLNTQKTGVDNETPIYNYIRNLMIKTARPLIDFLAKKYDQEKENLDLIEEKMEKKTESEGEKESTEIKLVPLEAIEVGSTFQPPSRTEPKIKLANISYKKPEKLVKKLKEYLKVTANKDVGEKTFDYFIDLEGIKDD